MVLQFFLTILFIFFIFLKVFEAIPNGSTKKGLYFLILDFQTLEISFTDYSYNILDLPYERINNISFEF